MIVVLAPNHRSFVEYINERMSGTSLDSHRSRREWVYCGDPCSIRGHRFSDIRILDGAKRRSWMPKHLHDVLSRELYDFFLMWFRGDNGRQILGDSE